MIVALEGEHRLRPYPNTVPDGVLEIQKTASQTVFSLEVHRDCPRNAR